MKQLTITGLVRVDTENSVWLLDPNRYMRLPRVEMPRAGAFCLDEGLDDARWLEHRSVWLESGADYERLRIFPAWRPESSQGIRTGPIVASDPPVHRLIGELPAWLFRRVHRPHAEEVGTAADAARSSNRRDQ